MGVLLLQLLRGGFVTSTGLVAIVAIASCTGGVDAPADGLSIGGGAGVSGFPLGQSGSGTSPVSTAGSSSSGGAPSGGIPGGGGGVPSGGGSSDVGVAGAPQAPCSDTQHPDHTDKACSIWLEWDAQKGAGEPKDCDASWLTGAGYCLETCGKCGGGNGSAGSGSGGSSAGSNNGNGNTGGNNGNGSAGSNNGNGSAGRGGAGSGGGGSGGGGGNAGSGNGSAGTGPVGNPGPSLPNLTSGNVYWASRYWDCCKTHCATNAGAKSCGADGVSGNNGSSACVGGSAYACYSEAPRAVGTQVSYGHVAVPNPGCNTCYHLQFTGTGQHNANDPGSKAIAGKHMIVRVSNTGGDVAGNQFDLMIPGGGVGINQNTCTKQWNVSASQLGATSGGFMSYPNLCYTGSHDERKACVRAKCSIIPAGPARDGCLWWVDWLQLADNPNFRYAPIACPSDL